MVKAGCARGGRLPAGTFPGVEPDVMMVAAGLQEGCLGAETLGQLKPQHATVKIKRALQVGNLQVNMTDAHRRIDGWILVGHDSHAMSSRRKGKAHTCDSAALAKKRG